jgi:high-affinity iron transporter
MKRLRTVQAFAIIVLLLLFGAAGAMAASDVPQPSALQAWRDVLDAQLVEYYIDPGSAPAGGPASPDAAIANWGADAQAIVRSPAPPAVFPLAAGRLRARVQQATVVTMARAVRAGRIADAQALRAELDLPRGVSASEGALILQSLHGEGYDDAARLLVREAITWQTTRVRQLFDEATRDAAHPDAPLPGRLMEQLGEALALADLPTALQQLAGITQPPRSADELARVSEIAQDSWAKVAAPLAALRDEVESTLPSLLSPKEKQRRERLLLKLVEVIPKEYASGVRDGQITVPLEYREAVSFTQQACQTVGELAPLWLAQGSAPGAGPVRTLEQTLAHVDQQITDRAAPDDVAATLSSAGKLLEGPFGISLHRAGTTADIVDEVMLETRRLLDESLAQASAARWSDAERLRVEAYTTYDPELEARLMPRDPQLATDIERLLLDGIDQPGVKIALDRHAPPEQLQAAYARAEAGLDRASAVLKSDISPAAAVASASSIVLREGLEGLLVIIAVLAGLRGAENASNRRLFWIGVAASVAATALTWILSQTIITSLRNYGEIIEAVTGLLAIGVLLLITNWLFHQVYWKQWVTTLKAQAAGESAWQLISVGFLIGYREGFETVLFLQSLVLDGGGKPVALGVVIGGLALIALGVAALRLGLKLPYFRILMLTAILIGLVLITFVGGTVRAAQTVGWLPVHRLTSGSWPAWMGNWLGLHNTCESIGLQVFTVLVVIGTWRIARWQAKRKAARRRQIPCAASMPDGGLTPCGRTAAEALNAPCMSNDDAAAIVVPPRRRSAPAVPATAKAME